MRLVTPSRLAQKARKGNYGVPAFNSNGANYDITRACMEAAQELQSPLILQVYEPNAVYRGFGYFVQQVKYLYDFLEMDIPLAVNLDHGKSLESCLSAICAGFSGVMIDASHLPLDNNCVVTAEVVRVAHALGVSVEAEVGYVGGNSKNPVGSSPGMYEIPQKPSGPLLYSNPDEVRKFLDTVDIDLLAVSVGTVHGVYKEQTEIDFNLVREINGFSSVPLVQHGTGGVSPELLRNLVEAGMAKVNFGEPLRLNYIRYFVDEAQNSEHQWHTWRIMESIKERLKLYVKEQILALKAEGRANI
ncbi:MAG: hypothetical protein A3J97_04090 [Spirochaetes bacterium RIFOXYC1_FULL_54_7]|nr:MAG: hypothetical protein A3J97_04090 [Spirochaetes bacterium RIFOXYC1_FULL_54_7]